jgi:hypothetical protein
METMNENEQDHKPYWKRIHHSWIFWVFLFLMFVGIIYYIMTVDFSLVPHRQLKVQEKSRTL